MTQSSPSEKKNGAYAVMKELANQGVEVVFGYPGGAVIPLYHEWFSWQDKIKHYRCSHEQNAVHAADGYARATGKVGVCFVTSGPGATNTVTGIATAFMDSVPLVVISGQVPSHMIGKDSFQEVDITGITMSITKHNFRVKSAQMIESVLKQAFKIARSGRPGPVLVDIPKNFLLEGMSQAMSPLEEESVTEPVVLQDLETEAAMEQLVEWIGQSKRPLIYAGGGIKIANAEHLLKTFAEDLDIPVVNSLMGLGTLDRRHDLSLGLVGMHGSREANLAVDQCDLLIAIGVRFSDRVIGDPSKFASKARIVHLDRDPTEHNKNCRVDLYVTGDVKEILINLLPRVRRKENPEWRECVRNLANPVSGQCRMDDYFEILNHRDHGDVIYATDVGQHQMWAAQKLKIGSSRQWLTSGGLGTMGFGLGAAIGAKVAYPDRRVTLITGDGSFRMNLHELATLMDYGIKVDIVLIQNGSLGMVRQWQTLFQSCVYAETRVSDRIDYQMLASAFGLKGCVADTPEKLRVSLLEADRCQQSTLTVIPIHKDDQVLPIVPPGLGIANFIE